MKTNLKRIMAVGLLCCCSASAFAVELIKWERLPIPVPLVKDQERVIFLDKNVRVGVSSKLSGQLRIQSASGTLYLLATDEIEPSRLQVQDVETGEVILLDVATVPAKEQPLEAIQVVYDENVDYQRVTHSKEKITKAQDKALSIPAPVALTRYAAQMLYAPLRTVEPIPGIRQVPVKVSGPLPVFPMLPVKAEAVAAFKLGSYTLTAVRIQHQRAGKVELDPRDVQANLYSVAFQHSWLGSKNTPEDTTIAYMITRHGGLEKFLPLALMAPETTQELPNEK